MAEGRSMAEAGRKYETREKTKTNRDGELQSKKIETLQVKYPLVATDSVVVLVATNFRTLKKQPEKLRD